MPLSLLNTVHLLCPETNRSQLAFHQLNVINVAAIRYNWFVFTVEPSIRHHIKPGIARKGKVEAWHLCIWGLKGDLTRNPTHQIWSQAETSELPDTALGRFGLLLTCSVGLNTQKQIQLKLSVRNVIFYFILRGL